jgi:two-component system, NtrC family, sensor kinase
VGSRSEARRRIRLPIAAKLMLSFLLIITLTSVVFSVVGVQLIGNQIVSEAQSRVSNDLNAAREIYLGRLREINDVVRFTADKYLIRTALSTGDLGPAAVELRRVKEGENLDLLSITDSSGKVLLRANATGLVGDDQSHNELVQAVMVGQKPVVATMIMPAEDLQNESPLLAQQAYFKLVDTPKARPRPETEATAGMLLEAAAPVFDQENHLVGIIYGGVLANHNYGIVDKIKQTVFQDVKYNGQDMGTATIFQDDVRISTNVRNEDGSRAIGTRIAEDVYNQVVGQGIPWIGRAYVVNSWYITAYEPIRSLNNRIVGILYVGLLEQKYVDSETRTMLIYLVITFIVVLVSVGLSYLVSRRISESVRQLVAASQELTHGNLEVRAEVVTNDELRDLADSFNSMASALKKRDEQLKEFTRRKIIESERLAIIGQLAAGVAHELNNPLQGIVTYSCLLLEKSPEGSPGRESIQKIVTQANRCTQIIRGLLDFSRPHLPQKRLSNVDAILQQCVALVEDQALFHNIELVRHLAEALPQVVVDPAQIQQVFMNMLINAAEAMNGEGRLTLTTRHVVGDGFVEIEFTDTGHGIDAENMERIFDPFFTTKEIGHGTGLGLAISYGFIKEHHGTISVESEVGRGTTFTVRLPTSSEARG